MEWQGRRECFVPTCPNTTKNKPDKVFVCLREDIKQQWCRQVNAECYKFYRMYCCEDHLNLEEDLKNYKRFKKQGVEPKLMPTAKLRIPNAPEAINKEASCKLLNIHKNNIQTQTNLNNSEEHLPISIEESSKAMVEDKIEDNSKKQCNPKLPEPNEETSCILLKLLTSNVQIPRSLNKQKLPTPMEECLKAVQEDEIDIGETIKIEDTESISSVISIKSDEGATVCRTCLAVEALVPLWSTWELDGENATLGSLLEEVVGVMVEEGQTELLCNDCSLALRAAAAFRRKAIRADQTLRPKHEVSTDPQQAHSNALSEQGEPNKQFHDLQPEKHRVESPKDHIELELDKMSDNAKSCSPQLEREGEKLIPQPETDSDDFTWPEEEPLCHWLREKSKRRVMKLNRDSVCSSQSESDQSQSSQQRDRDRSWSPQLLSEEEHSSGSTEKPVKKNRKNNKPKEYVKRRTFGIEPKRKRKKIKDLQCIECGWMTDTMRCLELHMLRHTGERPHQCSECGRGLATKVILQYHLQTHKPKKERPRNFICDICGRGFYRKSNILQHMPKHMDTRFVCQSCGHAFAWKHNLNAHLKRVHGVH